MQAIAQTSLTYISVSWNQNSQKIDTAQILFKRKKDNKVKSFTMTETEPDSGIFETTTKFNLNDFQIYIPAGDKILNAREWSNFQRAAVSGQVEPHFVLIKNIDGEYTADIYASVASFEKAQQVYAEQLKAEKKAKELSLSNSELLDEHVNESERLSSRLHARTSI